MKRFTQILLALTVTGCASSSVQTLSTKSYQAKEENCTIPLYTDGSRIGRKYTEIAIVTHKTQQDLFTDKGALKITRALNREACKLGADGLIVKTITQGTWGDPGRGEGVAIKFE